MRHCRSVTRDVWSDGGDVIPSDPFQQIRLRERNYKEDTQHTQWYTLFSLYSFSSIPSLYISFFLLLRIIYHKYYEVSYTILCSIQPYYLV
jgi:hypothetical protein